MKAISEKLPVPMANRHSGIIILFLLIIAGPHVQADEEEKKTLKVAVVIQPPFIERDEHANGSIPYRGICIDLMRKIANNIQFEYEIYEAPDGQMVLGTRTAPVNGMDS